MYGYMHNSNINVKHNYSAGDFVFRLSWSHSQAMKNLREIRKSVGLSQIELSEKAGVSQGMISRMENGTANPTLDIIEAVAEALNVPPPLLFGMPEFHTKAMAALNRMDPEDRPSALHILERLASD